MSLAHRTTPYLAALLLALPLGCNDYPITRVGPGPIVLLATLTTQVTDVVTFTFTVTNPSAAPVQIDRTSGQRYDFTIVDPRTHTTVWRWSADKVFTQMLGSETLPPGASLTYVEQWTPTVHGDLVAEGSLAGGQQVTASSAFRVP